MSDIKGSSIVKEGFLVKSPPQDKLMAAWHKRYFVLWSGGFMEYYSSSDKKPQDYLKTIDLNGCEDMVAPYPISGRTYIIKVALTIKGKNRDYFFDCENQYTMDEWVEVLASVCGFTAIDCEVDEDNFDAISPAPKSMSPPPIIPPFRDQSPMPSLANRPKLRPPLPPPNPVSRSSPDGPALYEDPNHVDFFADEPDQDLYDCSISDAVLQKLNTRPPPVWKNPANSSAPPPLPPTRHSKRFTRSFSQHDFPPPLPDRSTRDDQPLSNKKLPKIPKLPFSFPKKHQPVNNRPSTPPPLPASNFKADLGSKLKERKNNLTRSWSEDEQLQYEDIDVRLSRDMSPRRRLVSSDSAESDTGSYVECDPNEPQSYIDPNESNSLLRNDWRPMDRDWSPMPPPLPSRAGTSIAPTSFSDDEEVPPPVPVRHPQASGRTLPKPPNSGQISPHGMNNPVPLPPRAKSPILPEDDDDAPPVPVRRVESSRPPLNRPHSEKNIHSLHPPTHHRGGSVPTIGTRLPIPPPKTNHPETDRRDIFENVIFNNKLRNNHRETSPAPKQSPQPSWITDSVSNRSSDDKPSRSPMPPPPKPSNDHRESSPGPRHSPQPSWITNSVSNRSSDDKPSRSSMPPRPKPSNGHRESSPSPRHGPQPSWITDSISNRSSEDKPSRFPMPPPSKPSPLRKPPSSAKPTMPKVTPPPPVSSKPKPFKSSSLDNQPTNSPQNIDDAGPPVSSRIKKKWPDPSLSNGNESRAPPETKAPRPPTAPKNPSSGKKVPEASETRRKLDTSFLNKMSESTSNPPFKPKKPSPEPPTPYRNGPEIARKPMPPTPQKKPVPNKFQNSDLAACLQNNNPSSRRPLPGGSSHKPMAPPPKPKPLLPPSYR